MLYGLYGDNGKENGNYYSISGVIEPSKIIGVIYWGYYIPIMENQMEKKMENEMETGIIRYDIRVPLGLYTIMEKKMETLGPFKGVYRVLVFRGIYESYIGIMEKNMEAAFQDLGFSVWGFGLGFPKNQGYHFGAKRIIVFWGLRT